MKRMLMLSLLALVLLPRPAMAQAAMSYDGVWWYTSDGGMTNNIEGWQWTACGAPAAVATAILYVWSSVSQWEGRMLFATCAYAMLYEFVRINLEGWGSYMRYVSSVYSWQDPWVIQWQVIWGQTE